MSMRNDNLTFQHHKVIAIDALNDEQRTELLQQAEDKNMSSKQLITARDVLLGCDTVKPVIDVQPEQTTDSATHEDHPPPL